MKPLSTALTAASHMEGQQGQHAMLKLATFLPYRLNVLASAISEGLSRLYGDRFKLDIPGWRVLVTIGEFRSITAKAIGQHARMSKVKVSRAAVSLESRGWIERRSNPDDLREAFLTLSGEGQRIYLELVPIANQYVEDILFELSAHERSTLDVLIDKLTKKANETSSKP